MLLSKYIYSSVSTLRQDLSQCHYFKLQLGKLLGGKLECLGEKLPPRPPSRLNPDWGAGRKYIGQCLHARSASGVVGLRQTALKVVTHSTALPGPQGGQVECTLLDLNVKAAFSFIQNFLSPSPYLPPPLPPPSLRLSSAVPTLTLIMYGCYSNTGDVATSGQAHDG